ncbi:DUF1972 domain-containing protein [Ichthyenterobacterium magnum]|uniref:Glycosyltransferase involved in cell wall biosynthesis n=1 Tax=Ichthyenterobacterium magnum TaxID=1230530 RepID=A0A420DXA1_9FLAO|nr:DUF1972 domain-containing protein [Ichthyenterobacterium magnum]RKE98839.1 glycosyltransferase involved in cell wall biosynthesis [Ichthyenterobacterium magnum]
MKIAILGTRGIPNNHGGFEQFAEYFSVYLASKNHDVYVYNSHDHPYQDKKFKEVNIIHAYDPEYKIGTVGQFIYDLKCILDSRKRKFDVILQLGYTSSSVWYWLLPKNAIIVTNMDGMEWKRSKYSSPVRKFLKYAEKLAVKSSDYLISDSVGIQDYIIKKYNRTSEFIAYGASVFNNPNDKVLSKYKVKKSNYCILIARLEPENNIATIVEGYHASNTPYSLIVFGTLNDFGKTLQNKYADDNRIQFVGANYNQEELNNLRFFSRYYFHGHSVGGTNPSLLEAMASNTLIIANNNIFNKSILEHNAEYFDNSHDISSIMNNDSLFAKKEAYAKANIKKIENLYSWDIINNAYESFISQQIYK